MTNTPPRLTKEQSDRLEEFYESLRSGVFFVNQESFASHLAQEIHAATLAERDQIVGVIEKIEEYLGYLRKQSEPTALSIQAEAQIQVLEDFVLPLLQQINEPIV